MSKLNRALVGDLQTTTLKEKIQNSIQGTDLWWLGYDHNSGANPTTTIVSTNIRANVNRVLLWLASKENDYVREPLKGGVLYNLLGTLNNSTNLSQWEDLIKSRFNEEFANDLDLLMLTLTPDPTYKRLYVQMIVRDKITNKTFPVSTEASE